MNFLLYKLPGIYCTSGLPNLKRTLANAITWATPAENAFSIKFVKLKVYKVKDKPFTFILYKLYTL
jgi:hypothetical protein